MNVLAGSKECALRREHGPQFGPTLHHAGRRIRGGLIGQDPCRNSNKTASLDLQQEIRFEDIPAIAGHFISI